MELYLSIFTWVEAVDYVTRLLYEQSNLSWALSVCFVINVTDYLLWDFKNYLGVLKKKKHGGAYSLTC